MAYDGLDIFDFRAPENLTLARHRAKFSLDCVNVFYTAHIDSIDG
jgi:hypothetical protein